MADRSPTKTAQLKNAASIQELNESELRGMLNMGYNELNEDNEDAGKDHKDGMFVVHNPEFVKKYDKEYMNELVFSPWYYSSITRSEAEHILNDTVPDGSFIVRSGLKEGEFYLSVRAPEGVHHIEVDRYKNEFVAVLGSSEDAMEFKTFNEIIMYLQATPLHYEGCSSELILKDFVAKDSFA